MNLLSASLKSALLIRLVSCYDRNSFISPPSVLNSYLGVLPNTCKGTLDCCPLVTPLNTNDSVLATNENDIASKFKFVIRDFTGTRTDPVPYNLYQSIGPNGALSAILQIIPPSTGYASLQPGDQVSVTVSLNETFYPQNVIPLVYSFLCNVPGARSNSWNPREFEIVFTYPNDPSNAVITISQLGYINNAEYKLTAAAPVALEYSLSTDIFTTNPFNGRIDNFAGIHPESFLLPTNETTVLQRLRNQIKRAAKIICVPEAQIKNMAVAAFINELGNLFRCNEVCKKPLCDQKLYVEYITFVTSCIKCIAYCEETKPAHIEICKPTCSASVSCSCEIVNREIVECARRWSCPQIEGKVCVEVSAMFTDIAPCEEYRAVCADDEYFEESDSVICPEEIYERSSCSSSEEERLLKEKKKKVVKKVQKRAAVKAKTTTSVSTYGWYAFAGVATITVAVVVYIFVL